jgi:hypothetical protein
MALVTVFDLITEALAIYGEYAAGESLDSSSVQSLLFTLNAAIDGLGAERLSIYSTSVLSYTTIAGKQSYTFGPAAADWVTAVAPAYISRAGVLSGGVELPLAIVNADEWAGIGLKSMQSTIPSALWPQYGPASHTLNFWPVPSGAFAVALYVAQQIPKFVAQTDTVSLPPGYQEFLTYDLAIKSSSKFGAPLPDWLPQAWREARTRIKERNYRAFDSRCDPALTQGSGRGVPSIDFYTGK